MGKFYVSARLLHPGNKFIKGICREGFSADEDRHAVIDEANGGQIFLDIEGRFGE